MNHLSRLLLFALMSCSTPAGPFAQPETESDQAEGAVVESNEWTAAADPELPGGPEESQTPGLSADETSSSAGAPQPAPASAFDHSHARWNTILGEHVSGEGFAYGPLAKSPDALYAYLEELHAVTPKELEGWTKDQRFAFWINAYNAHTIQKVIENYPLKSIRKLDKAFGLTTVFEQAWIPMQAFHPKGKDKKLSLNHIEHDLLRAHFPDARLHAAINCASESCPPLRNEAFIAERLDEQLQEQMEAFVRDASRNAFDREKGVARLSEIFKWFSGDFERDAGSVRDYVVRFAAPEDAAFLRDAKLRYLDYSWALNDVR